MQRLLIATLSLFLGIATASADSTVGNLGTSTTSPLPANSCLYVDQGPGTDTKLCSGYAAALGAMKTDFSNGTIVQNSPADGGSHSYTILSSDLTKQVLLVSTFTAAAVPQATGSFAAPASFEMCNAGAITATSTTSTINGIAGATGISLGANQCSQWTASGGNWIVALGMPQAAGTAAGAGLGVAGGLTTTIATGTSALGTGAISSATCAAAVTTSAPNTATTDVVLASFNGDPTAVTGYIPATAGMLTIIAYPTSGNVNFKVCNNTSSSITPGAITLNWRVVR